MEWNPGISTSGSPQLFIRLFKSKIYLLQLMYMAAVQINETEWNKICRASGYGSYHEYPTNASPFFHFYKSII